MLLQSGKENFAFSMFISNRKSRKYRHAKVSFFSPEINALTCMYDLLFVPQGMHEERAVRGGRRHDSDGEKRSSPTESDYFFFRKT